MSFVQDSHTRLVGVLGGMGPAATVDFYTKLIAATPASTDQQHLRVAIWSDPTVPDRSAAITGTGPDPTPKLVHGARKLKESGVDFYVVPCNGAHAFLPEVRRQVDLEYLSIIETTADHVGGLSGVSTAGILATDATLAAGLYQDSLQEVGVEPQVPTPKEQETVMQSIYALKSGQLLPEHRQQLVQIAERLAARGSDVIVAACTEVPLILLGQPSPTPIVDPAVLLADRVVAHASL